MTRYCRQAQAASLLAVLLFLVVACGPSQEVLIGDVASPSQSQTLATPTAATSAPTVASEPTAMPEAVAGVTEAVAAETVKVRALDVPANTDVYLGNAIELFDAFVTNAPADEVIADLTIDGEPLPVDSAGEPTGVNQIVVHFGVTTNRERTFYGNRSRWFLTDPDGRPIAAAELLDPRGQSVSPPFDTNSFNDVYAVFPTATLIADLDDWSFSYVEDNEVPVTISLSELEVPAYPLQFQVEGQTATIIEEPLKTFPCDARTGRLDVTVTEAVAQLDPVNPNSYSPDAYRVDRGLRWFVIRVDALNTSPQEDPHCSSQQLSTYEMALHVDGRPYSSKGDSSFMSGTSGTREGTSSFLTYRFVIPVEAQRAELVWGLEQNVVESWDLALPLVPTE